MRTSFVECIKLRTVCFVALSLLLGLMPNLSWPQDLKDLLASTGISDFEVLLTEGQWSEQSLSDALISAAGQNLPAQASLLLDAGADPNYAILWQNSVTVASFMNSAATLEVLINNGGEINFRSMFSWTPLHHAINSDGSRLRTH